MGSPGTPLSWIGGVAKTPRYTPLPHVLPYPMPNLVVLRQKVFAQIEENPKNCGVPGQALRVGAWLTSENKLPPHMRYHVEFGGSAIKDVHCAHK